MTITRPSGFPVAGGSGNGKTSITVVPANVGDLIIVYIFVASNSITVSGVSGGHATGWAQATAFTDTTDTLRVECWTGVATATGSAAATISYSGTVTSIFTELDADSLHSSLGSPSWSVVTGSGQHNASNATFNLPALVATATGQAYSGMASPANTAAAGTTTGFTYNLLDSNFVTMALNVNVSAGTITPNAKQSPAGTSTVVGIIVTDAGGGTNQSVSLTAPNVALAAPAVTPTASGGVSLTAPNVALAAPTVTPAETATVALTTPNVALAAPAVTPTAGATVTLTAPNVALVAPIVAAGANRSVSLTAPNVALVAPTVTPEAGKTVTLTAPNVALAAPAVTPKAGATVSLTTPNVALSAPTVAPPVTGFTFPATPLGVEVELDLTNDGWTDITGYVKLDNAAGVTITYGRADAQTSVNTTTAAMTWNNFDGRFSPRNPTGAYYGQLGRNTPVRVSVPADTTHLRLATDNESYISTPDSSGLSLTGSIEIGVDVHLSQWWSSAIASKWVNATERSWVLLSNNDGTLTFEWSNDGSTVHTAISTLPLPTGGRMSIVVDFDHTTGNVTFFTGGAGYLNLAQLGEVVTGSGSTSIFDSTAPVQIGASSSVGTSIQDRVYNFYYKTLGGSNVAYADFTTATPGDSTFTDANSNVWTLAGTAEFSDRDYMFHGEAAALPQQWDRDDIWTPVSTAGVLRRIDDNNAVLDSPLKRGYVRLDPAPIAYWPAEDLEGSTQIAAAIGGRAMEVNGAPGFGGSSVFVASLPIPVLNGSSWSAPLPKYTGSNAIVYRFLMNVPSGGGEPANARIARIHTSGDIRTFTLEYTTGGGLEAFGYDKNGNQVFDSGNFAFGVDGEFLRVSMELVQNGSVIDWNIVTVKPGATTGLIISGSVTSSTVGKAVKVFINPAGELTQTAIGHISVQNEWDTLFDLGSELDAWRGETAGERFYRLCTEENVNVRIFGPPSTSEPMGIQDADTLVNLLTECETADAGMMFEPTDVLGLGLRTSGALVSQTPAVALDYEADQLSPPLAPTDDDMNTQNDITLTRNTGSSARAVLDDGSPMSNSSPPNGVGSYTYSNTVYVQNDSQLNNLAYWTLHLGTVNEERYPGIMVDLAATSMQSLFYPVMGVKVGDVVTVDNLPYFLPPDGIAAMVWGKTVVLGDFVANVTWQTQPSSPYNVLYAGTGAVTDCRADTDGSSLHSSATSTATTLSVDTQSGSAIWTTVAADFPFDIIVGGERMTVTNITGTSSPQSFTVTRSVNGVVKAHDADEAVALFSPVYLALN